VTSVYSSLLSKSRFRPSEVTDRHILLEAESDRGRLLFCPAFRRLQQKAQVFSMESNASVRSRLTHSLEVAQVGRYIADQISIELIKLGLAEREECAALTTFVETACLMHDIGNPPFGHFGEFAISEWFRNHGVASIVAAHKDLGEEVTTKSAVQALADFFEFDGNPQGIRIVARLQRNTDEFGLNLTMTTLAAYLKYVRTSGIQKVKLDSPFVKKCGYFSTEKQIIEKIWTEFGYSKPQRFPLAYIMEAADDIAYCISDLEDSIEKGLLEESVAFREILQQWASIEGLPDDGSSLIISEALENAARGRKEDGKPYSFTDFRTNLNRALVNHAASQYVSCHDAVLSGTMSSLISSTSSFGKILDILKGYCRERVYCHESVQKIELAGYKAISGLLDHFSCLLTVGAERFACALRGEKRDGKKRQIVIESKLLSLFPKRYIAAYWDQLSKTPQDDDFLIAEWVLRAHLITDFISGMTDDFSMTTYQSLSGIRL
jgi:dGTPase